VSLRKQVRVADLGSQWVWKAHKLSPDCVAGLKKEAE
jgi:hypothetical protein